jgi:hypothetical protein
MSLKDHLDLNKAYKRVQQDKRDDSWPDVANYADYERLLAENLEILRSQITTPSSYQAKMPLNIEMPKKGFTLRPGAVPMVDDRIVYQAIADLLSPHFQPESCVYSNRINQDLNSSRMFIHGVDLWLKFQEDAEKLCSSFPFMVETDITAYFEHINHDLMLHRIQDIFAAKIDKQVLRESKQLLQRMWRKWSRNKRFGIPQVNDASSFFANLYLDEFDKWMMRRGYVFMRYVDDMRIFAADEPSARRALAELITQLREMGLYVSSAKTAVKFTEDILLEAQGRSQQIDHIEHLLKSKESAKLEQAASMLEGFITELITNPTNFDDRHFRYCVNRFKKLKVNDLAMSAHDNVARAVLERLTSMPQSTDVFVDYLSLFPEDEFVQRTVIEFLEGAYNIYPWQEMLLLELLIRFNIVPELQDRVLSISRAIARNEYKHPACRGKAYVFWGKNGDYADRREMRNRYFDESREDIRRAILIGIQEMQTGELDNFLESILNDSFWIRMTAQYVRGLNNPKYHYYNPPAGFDIVETWESVDLDDLPNPSS